MAENDAAAVARVLAGDQNAFRLLVENHSRRIFRLAYRMTGSEVDSEDLVQEIFLRAFQQLNRFESRSHFGTWLYRIGVNCTIDFIRRHQRRDEPLESLCEEGQEMPSLIASSPTPDRLAFSREIHHRVGKALDRLTATERAAFILRHFEEMSLEEVGTTLGLGLSATKHTIFRAVKKIRQVLQPMVRTAT